MHSYILRLNSLKNQVMVHLLINPSSPKQVAINVQNHAAGLLATLWTDAATRAHVLVAHILHAGTFPQVIGLNCVSDTG